MYCVKCGVKLGESEKKCPLCNTVVYHPDMKPQKAEGLYPENKLPEGNSGFRLTGGAVIILYLVPMIVCLFADWQMNGRLDWFGYVAGGLMLSYITVALPQWFEKPNPVIFVPCSFAALAVYLIYIEFATGGDWYFIFALPVVLGLCLITCTVVTLTHYLKKGWLYIFGGAFIALGGFVVLIELLLREAFGIRFIGWSVYPLIVLVLLGGLLIYLAINRAARDTVERKLFF